MSPTRPAVGMRADYRHFLAIPTRWMDNDFFGHVNNVIYYAYFDTLINRYLIDVGGFDFRSAPVIGLAVESLCRFHRPLAYPDTILGGLRVGHLGASSVRYEIGLFLDDAIEQMARAEGHFVHVFVERQSERSTPIPAPIRRALERLVVAPS